MIQIPLDRLPPDLLHRLVEEFVTREGTDYGTTERSLDEKIEDVLRQLRRGEVVVTYDEETETTNLVPARSLR